MSRIQGDRLIVRQGNRVILLNPQKMQEICEYQRVTPIDVSWYPER